MLTKKQIEGIFTLSQMGWPAYSIAREIKCDIKTVSSYLKHSNDYQPPPEEYQEYQLPHTPPRIAQPPSNYQQEYYQPRRAPQKHVRFRNHRDQQIENKVEDELTRMAEYAEYNAIPPLPLPELYELKQQLRRQYSRELDEADFRKKQDDVAQQEKSELERLKNLVNLNNIKQKLDQQQGQQTHQANPALAQLQQQLAEQAEETRKLTEELSARKKDTILDRLNQLESKTYENQKKSEMQWWQK